VLAGRRTLPTHVTVLERHPEPKTLLQVRLTEGRNRQIRRVAAQLGHPVIALHRTAIGAIQLQAPEVPCLISGQYRPLKDAEISFLNAQLGLTSEGETVTREEYSR